MKYLFIDSDGDETQVDELDQDHLSSFNDNEGKIFRFDVSKGQFETPVVDEVQVEAEEGEDEPDPELKIIHWVGV